MCAKICFSFVTLQLLVKVFSVLRFSYCRERLTRALFCHIYFRNAPSPSSSRSFHAKLLIIIFIIVKKSNNWIRKEKLFDVTSEVGRNLYVCVWVFITRCSSFLFIAMYSHLANEKREGKNAENRLSERNFSKIPFFSISLIRACAF